MHTCRAFITLALLCLAALTGCDANAPTAEAIQAPVPTTESAPTSTSIAAPCDFDLVRANAPDQHVDLPEGAIAQLGWGSVHDMSLSPDGKCAAVLTTRTLFVYDTDSLQAVRYDIFSGGYQPANDVEWSPDGKLIAVALHDIVILDATTGEEVTQIAIDSLEAPRIDVAWSQGSELLAVSYIWSTLYYGDVEEFDSQTVIFDAETGREVREFDVIDPLAVVAASNSGRLIASAVVSDEAREITVLEAETGRSLFSAPLELNEYPTVHALAFSPDETKVAALFGDDGYYAGIHVVDVLTGQKLYEIQRGELSPWSVAWSPDSADLLVGWSDGALIRVNGQTGSEIAAVSHHFVTPISIAWLGERIIAVSGDGHLVILDTTALSIVREVFISFNAGYVNGLDWSPDGTMFASGDASGQVLIWDAQTYELIHRIQEPGQHCNCGLRFSPDSTMLVAQDVMSVSNSPDLMTFLSIWDTASGELIIRSVDPIISSQRVTGMEWSTDGSAILLWGWDFYGIIWHVRTGNRQWVWRHPDIPEDTRIRDAVWLDHDTPRLVSWGRAGSYFWSPASSDVLIIPFDEENRLSLHEAALSPDGSLLAAVGDGQILLWDTQSGRLLEQIRTPYSLDELLVFSLDGSLLAVQTDQGFAVWDTATGQLIGSNPTHPFTLSFSPDGTILAAGYGDGLVMLWDVNALIE